MSSHTSKQAAHADDNGDEAAESKKKGSRHERSVAITFMLPDHVTEKAADEIRAQILKSVKTTLEHRLGKIPPDLIVH